MMRRPIALYIGWFKNHYNNYIIILIDCYAKQRKTNNIFFIVYLLYSYENITNLKYKWI